MAKVAVYDFDRGVFGLCCGQVYGDVYGGGEEVGVLIFEGGIDVIPRLGPEVVNINDYKSCKSCIFGWLCHLVSWARSESIFSRSQYIL